MYRRYILKIGLSLERNTEKVPHDGKYYILKDGVIIENFRSQSQADKRFKQMVDESGFKPELSEIKGSNNTSESLERFLRNRTIFHSEGAKFRGRGGRGR